MSAGELKKEQRTELHWYSSAPLMISLSFGMFTAVRQYVANECRVATMQEEEEGVGVGGGYGHREILKVGVREEGSGLWSWYNTLTKQRCLDGACWRVI